LLSPFCYITQGKTKSHPLRTAFLFRYVQRINADRVDLVVVVAIKIKKKPPHPKVRQLDSKISIY
jgi:hypothetical protein